MVDMKKLGWKNCFFGDNAIYDDVSRRSGAGKTKTT
jgi:hypothetical protein